MSAIFTIKMNNVNKKDELKFNLTNFIEGEGWGVSFETTSSVILYNGIDKSFFVIDLSDFPGYHNCERLLNADWCKYNDEENRSPLSQRLNFIKQVIGICLSYANTVEIFVSDADLTKIEDFEFKRIKTIDFVPIMTNLYNVIGYEPSVHFTFKR